MVYHRRFFLKAFFSGVALTWTSMTTGSRVLDAQQQDSNPPNHTPPSPMKPVEPPPFQPPTMAQLRQNEREIKKDVDQLFDLAQDLKRQAAKSDASQELSVGLIEKTEEIEKLAKKIRDLARS